MNYSERHRQLAPIGQTQLGFYALEYETKGESLRPETGRLKGRRLEGKWFTIGQICVTQLNNSEPKLSRYIPSTDATRPIGRNL